MPADVELARRPGVELVRTGRFQTLTGSWNPTPADIKAAVEAMDCPAIRKPVIRIGHTDRRFVGDGEPALGWFENLRATDGGHTLVADQVTLPWLHSVQAAAYPSRSIEGNYNHRCSEGHLHPFVIHTVALLGVTAPGVQTLRSLNDLPDMLGVAASGEVPEGAEHVQVTVLAGRHSAPEEFEEALHPRDHDGKFTHGGDHSSAAHKLVSGASSAPRTVKMRDADTNPFEVGAGDGKISIDIPHEKDEFATEQLPDISADLDAASSAKFTTDLETLNAERNARVAEAKKLSEPLDKAEAAGETHTPEYKAALAQWRQIAGDGQTIAGGEVPVQGGSLVYEMRMGTENDDTSFYLAIRPSGSTADWDVQNSVDAGAGVRLEQPGFRKLLKAIGSSAKVSASADPDGDGDGDEEPTGAMVALIPTAEDAARLVVDGGEAADQLHLTLAYLGDASDLDASARQDLIDAVSTAVNGMPVVDADIFSVAAYNVGDATDRDACLVYQLSGDLLAAVQEALDDALDGIDQSQEPWFAHITALWSDDLGRLPDLVSNQGPVSFDRVRIAVAGQTVDIPLIDDPQPDSDMVDYGDPDGGVYAANAAGGNTDRLKKYWLTGPGLAKWADKPHPWTALYKQLLKYIKSPDEAKRTASQWYREHFGHMPNQKGVHASAEHPFDEGKHKRDGHGKFAHEAGSHIPHASEGKTGGSDKAPAASRTVRIRDSGGEPMFLEFSGGTMSLRFPYDGDTGEGDDTVHHGADHFDSLKLDKATTGDFADELATISETRDDYVKKAKAASDRLDKAGASGDTHTAEYKAAQDAWFQVGGDGQRILGGELPGDKGTLVYEMRMGTEVNDTEFLMALKPPDAPDDWDLNEAASDQAGAFLNQAQFKRLKKEVDASTSVAASAPTPVLPAAEPEPNITDPKEDLVSDLSAFRSRLGLDDTADEQAILSALDELKTKADTPAPAEPTEEMVSASAAAVEQAKAAEAEKDELRKEVQILASQMKNVSDELASAKAEKAATVKASVFEAAIKDGKIKPADREQWETDYDEAPAAVTRVLASIAVGTAVPVMASGVAGSPEPEGAEDTDAEFDREFADLFSRKVN